MFSVLSSLAGESRVKTLWINRGNLFVYVCVKGCNLNAASSTFVKVIVCVVRPPLSVQALAALLL